MESCGARLPDRPHELDHGGSPSRRQLKRGLRFGVGQRCPRRPEGDRGADDRSLDYGFALALALVGVAEFSGVAMFPAAPAAPFAPFAAAAGAGFGGGMGRFDPKVCR